MGPTTRAEDASRSRLARDHSRALLVTGALAIAALVVLGPPTRLLALLPSGGAASQGQSPTSTSDAPPSLPSTLAEPTRPAPDSVRPGVTDRTDPSASDSTDGPGGDVTQGRWGATPARPPTAGLLIEELRGGWRVEGGNEEAAALAVIAAHAWAAVLRRPTLTPLDTGGERATGAIVAIEAVERPGAHHAVVTLLVAPAGANGSLHRIAVPIAFGPTGPEPAGAPWELPAPSIDRSGGDGAPGTALSLTGTAVADPELIASARRALDAVGLPGDRLVALEATDGWPFIARLDDDSPSHPWLRWHLDRFVVTGLPLARTGSAPP